MSISTIAYEQMRLIFNRLPEHQRWTQVMSADEWEEHVMEQLANTSLPIEVQEGIEMYMQGFYCDYFSE